MNSAAEAQSAIEGLNGKSVDGRDLTVLANAWNSCIGGARYNAAADLNHRGSCIDAEDFHHFMAAFGQNCAP